MKKWKHYFFI